ncbi:MAG: hypothetical protein ACJAUQ_001684, partial [Maribacter sp.]
SKPKSNSSLSCGLSAIIIVSKTKALLFLAWQ